MELYQYSIRYILYVILIIFIYLIIKDHKKLRQFKIKQKTWLILLSIFTIGLVIRIIFPSFHMMYVDEPWHMEMAKNMNQGNGPVVCEYDSCRMPLKPPGWPFLISILQLFTGLNTSAVFWLATIIGSLSVVLIFLLAYLLYKNSNTALWASFILALFPIHVIWSNTAGANNISVFFVLLTLTLFFIRSWAFIPALLLTISTRFELVYLIPILWLIHNRKSRYFQYYLPVVIGFIIISESIGHVFMRSSTLTLAHYYLPFLEFLRIVSFNFIFLLLAVFAQKKQYKTVLVLFISLFIIYLPIFSETRMALLPSLILILPAAAGIGVLAKKMRILFVAVILIIFIPALFFVHRELYIDYKYHMLETQAVNEIVEYKGIFVTAEPSVINAVANKDTIQTTKFLRQPIEGDIYYFYDGFCISNPIANKIDSQKRCFEMLTTFEFETVQTWGEFRLVKLTAHRP